MTVFLVVEGGQDENGHFYIKDIKAMTSLHDAMAYAEDQLLCDVYVVTDCMKLI